MRADDDLRISVTADWKDWRSTRVRVGDLRDIHWYQPLGAPHPLVHAYIACSEIVGDPPHVCDAARTPHQVRVCVLKSHNIPSVYSALARRADQPAATSLAAAPGAPMAPIAPVASLPPVAPATPTTARG